MTRSRRKGISLFKTGNVGWGAAVVVAVVLAVTGTAVATAAPPAYPRGPARMIVGGQQVTPEQTPAVALYTDELGFRCGATLIGSATVLTAAHCVTDEGVMPPRTTEKFSVRVGSTDRTKGQFHRVTRVTWHPTWSWTDPSADIAVLHLDTDAQGVQPARLARLRLPFNTDVQVVGWGYGMSPLPEPLPAPQLPHQLRTTDMQVLEPVHCRGTVPGITAQEDCLAPKHLLGEPCFGDSGGAEMYGREMVGIVSRGNNETGVLPCELGNTVFTDVSAYVPWIRSVTGAA